MKTIDDNPIYPNFSCLASDLIQTDYDYNKPLSISLEHTFINRIGISKEEQSEVTLKYSITLPTIYKDYPIEEVDPFVTYGILNGSNWSENDVIAVDSDFEPIKNNGILNGSNWSENDVIAVDSDFEPIKNNNYFYSDLTQGARLPEGSMTITFKRGTDYCPVERYVYIPKIEYNYVDDQKNHTFWYETERRDALNLDFMFPDNNKTASIPYNIGFENFSEASINYSASIAQSSNAQLSHPEGYTEPTLCWSITYPINTKKDLKQITLTPKKNNFIPVTINLDQDKLKAYHNITATTSIAPPKCNYDDAVLYISDVQGGLERKEYKYKINDGKENTFTINSNKDIVEIPLKDHNLNDFSLLIYDPDVVGDSDDGRNYRSITKEHLSFIRPPELKINSFESQDLRCHNDSSGSIEIKSVQRTYDDKELEYHWFKYPYTDELAFRGNKADRLPADSYRLVISNDGCTDTSYYTLNQPDTLLTSITSVTNAMCYGYSDGAITTDTSGGTQPLSFSWSNGATTKDIDHLPIGRYYVTVTDAHGCKADANETITQPAELINSLTPGYTICKGGELAIDDGRDNMKEFDSYEWHLPDSTIVHDRPIVVTTAMPQGKYALMSKKDVPGKKGKYCFTTDTTLITFADNNLPIRFLVPTESFFDDTLVIAEDSEIDDNYTWRYAFNTEMFSDITDKVVNPNANLTFLHIDRSGNDTITMYADNGFCKASLSKEVTVSPHFRSEDYDYTVDAAGIFSRLQIGPNPNNGEFTLFANLTEDSPLSIALYDVMRSRKIPIDFSKYKTPASHYQIPFQGLGLHSGAYTLLVSANGETKQIKFVVE
ncbi:MAG: SprB repeat-containing protein [Bacteroidales bacterium]|nr:SprB repeat-containing protein [Bacteroidales bacterium]